MMKRNNLLALAILSGICAAAHSTALETDRAAQDFGAPSQPGAASDPFPQAPASPAPVANSSGADDEDFVEWEPWCDFEDSIFPSFLIATAVMAPLDEMSDDIILGDPKGRLGIHITGVSGSDYELTLKKNRLMEESTVSGTIPDDGDDAYIFPKVLFDYAARRGVSQPVPLNLLFTMRLDDGEPEQQSLTVSVRSIHEALVGRAFLTEEELRARDMNRLLTADNTESFGWMYAAYINENHPRIDQILNEAIQAGTVTSFHGYQGGEGLEAGAAAEAVMQQVFRIWNVLLQRRGVKYSSIEETQQERSALMSQHVRFLDEVIDNTQANCVDGTLLFASVLRKIGLGVGVVGIPEHVFLVFATDPAGQRLWGLETTMVGGPDLASVGRDDPKLTAQLRERKRNEVPRAAFDAAVVYGTNELREAMARIDKGDRPFEYMLVSVAEARRMDVLPLSFNGPGK